MFNLAASLSGVEFRRPLVYQFAAALVRALGGRVRQVRIDRMVGEAYGATVEVDGPLGIGSIDARPSDALNLAVRVGPLVLVAPEVLDEAGTRRARDSGEADLLRRALAAPAMSFGMVFMQVGPAGPGSRETPFGGRLVLVGEAPRQDLTMRSRLRMAGDRRRITRPRPAVSKIVV